MAIGIGVQFIVFFVLVAIIVCLLVIMMRTRKAKPAANAAAPLPPAVEKPQCVQPVGIEQPTQLTQTEPVQTVPPRIPAAAGRQMPAKVRLETASTSVNRNEIYVT